MSRIVMWDFDGPIHDQFSRQAPYFQKFFEDHEMAECPVDFVPMPNHAYVSNLPFLRITLQILQQNGVISLIGSQRLSLEEGQLQKNVMLNCFDLLFGENREFLLYGDVVGLVNPPDREELNTSKNLMLERVFNRNKGFVNDKKSSIILVDDNNKYKAPAVEAGYGFVYAPRSEGASFEEDQEYLFETLVRTIPLEKIVASLEELDPNSLKFPNGDQQVAEGDIESFKQHFINYLTRNAYKVREYQVELRFEEYKEMRQRVPANYYEWFAQQGNADVNKAKKICSSIPAHKKFYKNFFERQVKNDLRRDYSKKFLLQLKRLIESTSWKTGRFGQRTIQSPSGDKQVPKRIAKIYDLIKMNESSDDSDWNAVFDEIASIGAKAANYKPTLFASLRKRDTATQEFYDRLREAKESYDLAR